ncbi:DNA-binding response regulator [Liquorilactobacillus sucicola DSM 21376 = JCM 15457]|uniref:Response regulator protein GraR n=1 Tax=Liquorilactobacillus sucicola DSM 21376 = JCM 15457 TaxID=1423806 RepID=A0A023CVW3_9LACO|nr:response regulator transcription factor [Liquorilactobacillus sucicola]KRN05616.1 response regulator protein GraR [Liquorilactobacillus sucicola DSM 21376 = JCM 15457]GAJ25701.1 DNA-binding response regulator [Liquorilactobacillus sucicola DSM 21376 = JCM 15457]
MPKIFVIEDDESILDSVEKGLAKWQYEVQKVHNWQKIIPEILAFKADLVIMDITLPTYDGFYWTSKIRDVSDIPVIFVSAAEMDPNAVRAIATGADDYITKPFSLAVLISKIQAVLRRVSKKHDIENKKITLGKYQLNALNNCLNYAEQSIKLTPTEGIIMQLFFLNVNQTISKERLMQSIWQGGLFISQNALNVNISRLRSKLAPVNLKEKLVTERGHGYRLVFQ